MCFRRGNPDKRNGPHMWKQIALYTWYPVTKLHKDVGTAWSATRVAETTWTPKKRWQISHVSEDRHTVTFHSVHRIKVSAGECKYHTSATNSTLPQPEMLKECKPHAKYFNWKVMQYFDAHLQQNYPAHSAPPLTVFITWCHLNICLCCMSKLLFFLSVGKADTVT